MKIFKGYVFLFLFSFFFCSCKSQDNENECKTSYSNANKLMGDYARTNEDVFLWSALNSLDTAIKCKETKYKSIDLKIIIYDLLKKYQNGQSFIDSLLVTDFNKGFKKRMYSDIFKASYLESIGDTTQSILIYSRSVINVKDFLEQSSKSTLDKDACASLFFLESKFMNGPSILKEIDDFKIRYPNEKDFLDTLGATVVIEK